MGDNLRQIEPIRANLDKIAFPLFIIDGKVWKMQTNTILLVLTFLLYHQTKGDSLKVCMEDTQMVNTEKIVWPSVVEYTYTTSKPFCIGDNLQITKRHCKKNGEWDKQPKCKLVQKDLPSCPDQMSRFGNICFMKLEAAPFDQQKCPYEDVMAFDDTKDMLNVVTDDYVWMPVQRDDTFGMGDYYYLEATKYFGSNFLLSQSKPVSSIQKKRCIVYHYQKSYKLVNCDDSYPKICAYDSLPSSSSLTCKQKNPDDVFCTQKSYNINYGCICMKKKRAGYSRNTFCKYLLAELNQPYQNQIKSILTDKTCWIGLEKINNKYMWSSSKTVPNYTHWSEDTEYFYKYGAISQSGWCLSPDYKLDCALCENTLTFNTPKLKLTYNKYSKKFVLEVRHFESMKVLETTNMVRAFCFYNSWFTTKHRVTDFGVQGDLNVTFYYFNPFLFGPALYWCEGFSYPNLQGVVSNTVFLYDQTLYGDEFVAKVTVGYNPNTNPLDEVVFHDLRQYLENYFEGKIKVVSIRKFQVLEIDQTTNTIQYQMHITTDLEYLNSRERTYELLREVLSKALLETSGKLIDFTSSNFCFKEETHADNFSTFWPTTSLGNTIVPKPLCVQENSKPVVRRCNGDFIHGAKWGKVQGRCVRVMPKSEITDDLQTLLEEDHPASVVVNNLVNLTEKYTKFEEVDVYLVGQIFQKIRPAREINLENVTQVVSHMTKMDRTVLVNSQTKFNATDEILKNYDTILSNSDLVENTSFSMVYTKNVILVAATLKNVNMSGIAIFNQTSNIRVEILNSTNLDILNRDNLEAVLILEENLIKQYKAKIEEAPIIVTAFFQDSLFNEVETKTKKTDGVVFGVLLSTDFTDNFTAPISFYYKKHPPGQLNRSCSHWNFALNHTRSHWFESGLIGYPNNTNFTHCEFWHATHFGLLIMTNHKQIDSKVDVVLLSIISTTNCIFSLLGLVVIFLTSLLFEKWRKNTGNQVLINFSLAITLQISLLYASDLAYDGSIRSELCLLIGALLHYSVISEFCWMLVIGILQFKRFVVVFGGSTRYILVKCCVVGWFIPTLPVLILLLVSPESYLENTHLCYPFGQALYFAVLLPIGLVLLANVTVFSVIIYDIFKKGPECSESYDLILQWRIVVLLYFMLGLTWIFGILGYLDNGTIFLYLFCFFATLQGFMLFLFFVIFNKATRNMYVNLFKQKYRKYH